MSKILNWTFGACFRTLGRFLAIFLVGALLIFIGSKIGIELPDWLALRVNAKTITGWAAELPTLSRLDIRECTSSDCSTDIGVTIDYFESPYELRTFVLNTNSITIGNNGYVLVTPGKLTANYLYQIEYYVCSNKTIKSSNYTVDLGGIYFAQGLQVEHNYKNIGRAGLDTTPIIDGGRTFYECNLYTGIVSPTINTTWMGLRIQSSSNVSGLYLSVVATNIRELGLYSTAIEDIIENSGFATSESVEEVQESVTQVQEEIQQTQDTITNEDTTGAEDSASGFFNDFTTETFGLTAIITAPLNSINSLISSTCSPLVFPLPYVDKNLSLPCMSSIYSEFFGGFFSIYQLITTGIISYYVIVRIFNLVKDFKNPDHDEIEVVDL